jgi:hypothetical protein
MEVALHSVGHAADARMAIVRSTADLDELWVSEALRAEVMANPALSILSTSGPLEFDPDGRLTVVNAPRAHTHSAVS